MKIIFTSIIGLVLKAYLAFAMLLVYREKSKANKAARRTHTMPAGKHAHA